MRTTESIGNPDFFVPGEEFYVTSDSQEEFGRVIIWELLRYASENAPSSRVSIDFVSTDGQRDIVGQYVFEDTASNPSSRVVHVTSRDIETESPGFEELICIQEMMREPGVPPQERQYRFSDQELTLEAMEKSNIHFFSENHYVATPHTNAFYTYVLYGYKVNGRDVLLHREESGQQVTSLDKAQQAIFESSVELMNFTVGPAQIADIVRALLALQLVTDNDVKRFVEKLP